MHEHDQDLIVAIAEGTLDAKAAAAAAADISRCSICSADLAAQRIAIVAIAGTSPVSMTAAESAQLRSTVASAVGIEPTRTQAPAPRDRRAPWGSIAIAAASLAGIIGVVPVLGLLTQGSDDIAAATTAAVVAFEAPENGADSQLRETGALDDTGSLADTEMASASPTETGTAGDTTSQATTEEAQTTTTTATTTVVEEAPAAALPLAGEDAVRDLFAAGPEEEYLAYGEQVDRKDLACSGAAERELGNQPSYIDVLVILDDGRRVVLYTDSDWTKLVAFDTDDCAVALVLP